MIAVSIWLKHSSILESKAGSMWRVFVALGVIARAESVKKNASAVHKSLPESLPRGFEQSPDSPKCKACCCIFLYSRFDFDGPAIMIDSDKDRPQKNGTYDPSVLMPWYVPLGQPISYEGRAGYVHIKSIEIQGDCWIQIFTRNHHTPMDVKKSIPRMRPGDSNYRWSQWGNFFYDEAKMSQGEWALVGDINNALEHAVTVSVTNTRTQSREDVSMKELTATVSASSQFLGIGVEATVSGTLSQSMATSISNEFATSTEKTTTYKCRESWFKEDSHPALKAAMWQWQLTAACYVVQTPHLLCTLYREGQGKPLCSFMEHCANDECSKCCCDHSANAPVIRPDCVDCRRTDASGTDEGDDYDSPGSLQGDVWFGTEDWDCPQRRSGSGCSDASLPTRFPDATSGAELRDNSADFIRFHLAASELGATIAASHAFQAWTTQKTPVFVLEAEGPNELFNYIYTSASTRIMNTLKENYIGGGYVFLWVRGADVGAQILAWQRPADGADLGEPQPCEAARVQVTWRSSRDTDSKFALVAVSYLSKEEEPIDTKDSDTLRPFMPVILP